MITAKPKPYKGPDYYRAEDQHLFYGRERDTVNVCSLILSRRLSLLHAASGTGKTSLLHARVMRALEDRGLLCVRSTPHNDPAQAIKAATLFRVLPDPRLEAKAIDCALAVCGPYLNRSVRSNPGRASLKDIVTALNKRVPRDDEGFIRARSRMTGEFEFKAGMVIKSDDVTPFFTRFLLSSRGLKLLARQVHAFSEFVPEAPWESSDADSLAVELATCPAQKLIDFFRRPDVQNTYREVLVFVLDAESGPDTDLSLRSFFERLHESWGSILDPFGIVLILDQFEEVFTRFVDQRFRGAATDSTLPDWKLRPFLFQNLARLLGDNAAADTHAGDSALPIRVLVSMRDDYIAEIDQLERESGTISQEARYHLNLLKKEDSAEVISGPAKTFGYAYEPTLLNEILDKLPTEGDLIEPGHIQIVCERLWDAVGKHIRHHRCDGEQAASVKGDDDLPLIKREALAELEDVDGILSRHFLHFINEFADPLDRIEILDMLEPMVTLGRRRNIVEESEIVEARFRSRAERLRLLEALRSAKIVRVEPRLSGNFVEITHEFLIDPIMNAIQQQQREDRRWRDLRSGLTRLEQIERGGFRSLSTVRLEHGEFEGLNWYRERIDPVDTKTWVAELMVRTAVLLGRELSEWQYWRDQVDQAGNQVECTFSSMQIDERTAQGLWLDHLELDALIEDIERSALDPETTQYIMESAVRNADRKAMRRVAAWLLEDSNANQD